MKKISKKAGEMTVKELASYIDYSVLKPEFTEKEIIELTKDGVQLGCATICINPGYIELCTPYVEGTDTGLCPVTDFPFGTSSTKSKTAQHVDLYDLFRGLRKKINRIFQPLTVDILSWGHGHDRFKHSAKMIGRACRQFNHFRKPYPQVIEFLHLVKHVLKPGRAAGCRNFFRFFHPKMYVRFRKQGYDP